MQVENLLVSNQGTIKLCDFGSATTIAHYPDYSWTAQRRATVEDEVSDWRDNRGAAFWLTYSKWNSQRRQNLGS